ncbi:MAG: HEPN domain-containing protein [Saprospiraceae bacterium]
MQFNWREYLSLSKELIQNKNEASYRSAISRAYYSIFNVLCLYINRFQSRRDKHKQLIDIFQSEDEWHRISNTLDGVDDDDLLHIGFEMRHLRSMRNKADYDNNYSITERTAQEVCEKVENIFEIIDEAQE